MSLDDVSSKWGTKPRSSEERDAMRKQALDEALSDVTTQNAQMIERLRRDIVPVMKTPVSTGNVREDESSTTTPNQPQVIIVQAPETEEDRAFKRRRAELQERQAELLERQEQFYDEQEFLARAQLIELAKDRMRAENPARANSSTSLRRGLWSDDPDEQDKVLDELGL